MPATGGYIGRQAGRRTHVASEGRSGARSGGGRGGDAAAVCVSARFGRGGEGGDRMPPASHPLVSVAVKVPWQDQSNTF